MRFFYVRVWGVGVCCVGVERNYFIVVKFTRGKLVIFLRGKIVITIILNRWL